MAWREPDEEEAEPLLAVEGLDTATIEPPALTLHPNAGDLLMFSSAMLHAVPSSASARESAWPCSSAARKLTSLWSTGVDLMTSTP